MKKSFLIGLVSIGIIGIVFLAVAYIGIKFLNKMRVAEKQPTPVVATEEIKVTFPEGSTLAESEAILAKKGFNLSLSEAFKQLNIQDYPIFAASLPADKNLEGYIFPDTYLFLKTATPAEILDKILKNFEKRMSTAGITASTGAVILPNYEMIRLPGSSEKGFTLHELLTLASIIEQETGPVGNPEENISPTEERKLVASVFLNRLENNIALQSDATVNYVTKNNRAAVNAKDLNTVSPYNTYKNRGLPPGPINNPSKESLAVLLNPVQTDYLYFLHAQPSGEVYFNKTLDGHNADKAKYLK